VSYPYDAGQVKCVYIDPPYNTGDEGWAYNDNVNSPVIRDWLGKTVGKEGETLDRHDRWLCMMYPRLALLRQFLSGDGAIFISTGSEPCDRTLGTAEVPPLTSVASIRGCPPPAYWTGSQYAAVQESARPG
jgi:hypothetical protein